MNCLICKSGCIAAGHTTMAFEKAPATVVVKGVPANICENCGVAFIAEEVARKVHSVANKEFEKGIEIEVVHYAA